jgi:hypothetical protein
MLADMAHAEMPPEAAMKKTKRIRNRKKTQKEKSMAKHAAAAAAEEAQQSVIAKDEMKATTAQREMIQDEIAAQHDVEALSGVVNAAQHDEAVAPAADSHAMSFAVQGRRQRCNHGTSVVALAEGESMVNNQNPISFYDDFWKEDLQERFDHALENSCTATSDSRTTKIPHNQNQPPSNQPENASSANLKAHRKALETALYDNTESPTERLARLRSIN